MKIKSESSKTILSEGVSLRIYRKNILIFENKGKWLYPLFELEEFIDNMNINAADLFLHDKVAGRAAASLITGMGFKSCYIDLISEGALEVFNKHLIRCSYSRLVENIDCMTEKIITPEMSPDQVYDLIKRRAGLLKGLDLEIQNIEAAYPAKTVLKGLNLSMKAGERLVITGDNGTGKSTLLKTIIGAVPLSDGVIILGGKEISKIKKRPSPVGYVSQNSRTDNFPLTAAEIVASGMIGSNISRLSQKYKIEIAMRRCGCFHLSNENFNNLSGGEKQRVSLARCLSQDASLILLDEPTSFLDKEAKEELLDILNKVLKREMATVLLVSHDHEWIEKLAWPVRELKDGKLC